jgi:hypothetical protein
MSYFKYKKRDASSRVDWNAISTSLVETLKEQETNRETQRQEIDKASRETGEILSDAPQGQNRDANAWILNASSDASQFMLTQNRLLKRGLLDPREFTVNRQNVEDSFKSLQAIATSAQEEYELTLKRMAQGGDDGVQSMLFEQTLAGRMNEFQDFSKNQVYFNPTTGVGSIGKLVDKDGVMTLSSNASDFTTISGAANQMKARYNKFDYTTGLGAWADGIGEDIRVSTRNGVLKVSDASGREFGENDPAYLEVLASLDSTIDAMMVGDVQVLSMAEDLGLVKGDNYNFDSEETNWEKVGDDIGVTTANDGIVMPKSNDALREAVREKLRIEAWAKLDYEETPTREESYQEKEARKDDNKSGKAEGVTYTNIANLHSGDDAMVQGAMDSLKNTKIKGGGTIINVDRSADNAVFTYRDGDGNIQRQTFDFYAGLDVLSQEEFSRSVASFFGIEDIDQAVARSSVDPNLSFNNNFAGSSTVEQLTEENTRETFEREIIEQHPIEDTVFVADDESKTVANLTNVVKSLPGLRDYKVDTADLWENTVIVKDADDKVVLRFELDASDGFNADSVAKYIADLYTLSWDRSSEEERRMLTEGEKVSSFATPTSGTAGDWN